MTAAVTPYARQINRAVLAKLSFARTSLRLAGTQAAGDLTGAGATSYTGPTQTSPLGSLSFVGSSSVRVTNVIETDVTFATTTYIGPQTIMVGENQSESFFLGPAGWTLTR